MKEGVKLSPLLPTPPQLPQAAPLAGKRRLWPTRESQHSSSARLKRAGLLSAHDEARVLWQIPITVGGFLKVY